MRKDILYVFYLNFYTYVPNVATLPRWLSSKESTCQAGDTSLIPGSERSLAEGNSNPLQYSYLENPMGTGAWKATVHGITKKIRHGL